MRKNSYYNRSKGGAETQAILMSIFQTLKQRKVHVTNTIPKPCGCSSEQKICQM